MSTNLIYFLCLEYIVLGVVAFVEYKYWLALYWFAAAILNVAVAKMAA